jgi:hypothetical protein
VTILIQPLSSNSRPPIGLAISPKDPHTTVTFRICKRELEDGDMDSIAIVSNAY